MKTDNNIRLAKEYRKALRDAQTALDRIPTRLFDMPLVGCGTEERQLFHSLAEDAEVMKMHCLHQREFLTAYLTDGEK
jgi:hypothetical protein